MRQGHHIGEKKQKELLPNTENSKSVSSLQDSKHVKANWRPFQSVVKRLHHE